MQHLIAEGTGRGKRRKTVIRGVGSELPHAAQYWFHLSLDPDNSPRTSRSTCASLTAGILMHFLRIKNKCTSPDIV